MNAVSFQNFKLNIELYFLEEIVFVILVPGTEEVPKQCCGVNLNNDLKLLF